MRRVVVTGCGLVTPLGAGVSHAWPALIAGKSGIKAIPMELCDTHDLSCKIAGIVPQAHEPGGFELERYISPRDTHKMDRFIQLAIAAAVEAVEDAGWQQCSDQAKERTGVMVGSGIGGLACIERNVNLLRDSGPRRISPFFIPASLINLASGYISIRYGYQGPNSAVVTACATGAHAIGDAARIIACNDADVMIAGGTEASICRIGIAGFAALRALSTNFNNAPQQASRPWDKRRDGFVMGEGAGIVVLEEYEHAKSRGANIYAELTGYGLSGDAYHITAPSEDGDGGYRAMRMAMNKAGLSPQDIGYINAHGTSTSMGDIIEIQAIRNLFGDAATDTAISSTKSAIGHLLGAAGGVEAIFSLLALRHGIIPPTLNLDDPDEGCEGLNLVPHEAQQRKLRHVLSNSFGFGGTNAALIFSAI